MLTIGHSSIVWSMPASMSSFILTTSAEGMSKIALDDIAVFFMSEFQLLPLRKNAQALSLGSHRAFSRP